MRGIENSTAPGWPSDSNGVTVERLERAIKAVDGWMFQRSAASLACFNLKLDRFLELSGRRKFFGLRLF
jgi:hypothetical protein